MLSNVALYVFGLWFTVFGLWFIYFLRQKIVAFCIYVSSENNTQKNKKTQQKRRVLLTTCGNATAVWPKMLDTINQCENSTFMKVLKDETDYTACYNACIPTYFDNCEGTVFMNKTNNVNSSLCDTKYGIGNNTVSSEIYFKCCPPMKTPTIKPTTMPKTVKKICL